MIRKYNRVQMRVQLCGERSTVVVMLESSESHKPHQLFKHLCQNLELASLK